MRFMRPARRLPLRARLAVGTAVAAFIASAVLAVFINAAALLLLRSVEAPPPHGIPAETWHLLGEIRVESLVGLGLAALLAGASSYWLAGRVLRPLRQVSQAALEVDTKTLDRRLARQGPRDELKELADHFDGMLDRLQRAFVREHAFVADASHELRTPLTVARANLEVVHLDPLANLDDYREMADALEVSLVRLERLVHDLLILASTECAPAREEAFLVPTIEDVLVDLRAIADQQGVRVSFKAGEQLPVVGDAELLQRALQNIIENAIQYNHRGGTVSIHMRRDGARVVIEIADTGMGISAADLPYIFDRFYRADQSRSRRRGGAGLGLALTREIVRRHGGEITVESRLDNGTTFRVFLPA